MGSELFRRVFGCAEKTSDNISVQDINDGKHASVFAACCVRAFDESERDERGAARIKYAVALADGVTAAVLRAALTFIYAGRVPGLEGPSGTDHFDDRAHRQASYDADALRHARAAAKLFQLQELDDWCK